jgi:ATP-dependent DNA helicase RecG
MALLEQDAEMSLAEVAKKVGRTLRAVEMATAKLVRDGKLRFVGPKKGGRWEVLK